jgi:cyclophilin family peptidyl-prolyl cis-trans isomerase
VGTDKRARQKANRQKAREARIRKQKLNKVRRRGMIFGIGIPVLVISLFGVAQLAGSDSSTSNDSIDAAITTLPASTVPAETIKGKTPCPKTDGTERRVGTFEQAPPTCIDTAKSYTATFDTSEGEVVVALDTKRTPQTVNNFVVLSRYRYYDGTPVFRTDPSIDIIQAGGPNNTSGPGYTIKDEGGKFTYKEGDLVMARSSGPDSGGAQFFFATGPKVSLLDDQGTYVTFGKVTKGLDVVKSIIGLHQADDSGLGGAPSRDVIINSITISES